MRYFKILLVSVLIILSSNLQAYTGEQLFSFCEPVANAQDRDSLNAGICLGFISGVLLSPVQNINLLYKTTDTKELKSALRLVKTANKQFFCIPETTTQLEIINLYVDYLSKRRAIRKKDASFLFYQAMLETYPCITKK